MSLQVLTIRDVLKRTGLGRTTLYSLLGNGDFPKPVRLSSMRRGWIASEIDGWIQARIDERDGETEDTA